MLRPPPLSPEAKDLLALWESKRQGRNMPSAGDFSAEELKRWSSCLIVLHAADNKDRFAYHSVGAEIAKYFSVDATGRKLSDIVDCRSLWAYGRIFEAMSLKIRPAHFVGPFDRAAHKVEVMERLILPCGEGRVVEHLLVYLRETESSRGVVCYELL